jgi:general secretion pathway protein I
LFREIPPVTDVRDAGFTIIEVLIALAVLATSIVAIGSVMSTNIRGVRLLEQHVTLAQTVRSVMTAEIPTRSKLSFGVLSGQVNDHKWKIDIGPMDQDWAVSGADVAWIPALVRIQVRSPSGAVSDLRTVRLIHGPEQP